MRRKISKKIVISLLIISIISMTVTVNPIAAAIEDEQVSIYLSSQMPRQAVALVPANDYTSISIDSTRPANISWRDHDNTEYKKFDILSASNASYEYPIHTERSITPVTGAGKINYADASWLIFNSTSTESYGEFIVAANHTSAAIRDNDEGTFLVDPDHNFHLRIAVGKKGPISIRLNTLPDKSAVIPNRYENAILFDPNGAIVNYDRYIHPSNNDEYFIFVAEEKGNYALIFNPISETLYFNVVSSTYKTETLKIEEELEPVIKGVPDSELTDEMKEDNPLTFDWYKYEVKEGQIARTHLETIRTIYSSAWFSPGINNTGYQGTVKDQIKVGTSDKRPDYIVVIHNNLARYSIGVEDLGFENLYQSTPTYGKIPAKEVIAYNFSILAIGSYRFELNSASGDVKIGGIYSGETKAQYDYETSTQKIDDLQIYNFFGLPGSYLLFLENDLSTETWYELTFELNSETTSKSFKNWNDVNNPSAPNAYIDGTKVELDTTGIPGVVKSQVLHYSSSFTDERFYWRYLIGGVFNDSNDLVADHEGQDIDFTVNFNVFTIVDGALIMLSPFLNPVQFTLHNNTNPVFSSTTYDMFPETMTSDTGDYWITFDSYIENNSMVLPYSNHLRFDIFDYSDYLYETSQTVSFTGDVGQIQNFNLNTSRYTNGMIVRIPVTWMAWIDVEIHYINGTVSTSTKPRLLIDIPNYFGTNEEYIVLKTNKHENPSIGPSGYNVIGNITTGFGISSNQTYVYLRLYCSSFAPDDIMEFNMTFRRLNTTLLNLAKECTAKPKGGAAPGFELMLGIFSLGTLVILVSSRKRRLSQK